MDFVKLKTSYNKGRTVLYPDFKVGRNKDIMFRGGDFYAVFDESTGLWSTDILYCKDLIDKDLYASPLLKDGNIEVYSPSDFGNNVWKNFTNYCKLSPQRYKELNRSIIFANDETTRESYASFKLGYEVIDEEPVAYNTIMQTIYDQKNLQKIEWAIGAVYSGDSRHIQKAIALYGKPGSGKSTVLHLIEDLFAGYCGTIDASAMGDAHNQFRLETIQSNPLVAIQNEADLSKLSTNVSLNSIISHDPVTINAKHKSVYTIKPESFIFIATNTPINITDSKSGLIRRIIDVQPSGNKIPEREFKKLEKQMHKELGAIANKCIKVYEELGENAYADYRPTKMMEMTDPLYQFMIDYSDIITNRKVVTFSWLKDAYSTYMTKAGYQYMPKDGILREQFKDYFELYSPKTTVDGESMRHVYKGLRFDKLIPEEDIKIVKRKKEPDMVLEETVSLLDEMLKEQPAQYSKEDGSPKRAWDNVKTKLDDIVTTKEHYILMPENHIVIDFDLKDKDGNKDKAANLKAASSWPETYAEFSRGGSGVHLHYIYNGDVTKLSALFDRDIEVKVFTGKSALRRKLSFCNNIPVAVFTGTLPLKEEKVLAYTDLKDEEHLRNRIKMALRKEINGGSSTRCCIDFIYSNLEQAYNSGIKYDVTDMKQDVMTFASRSTHQSDYCIKQVLKMKFKSEEYIESVDRENEPIIFFDCEVYPNLFVLCAMTEEDKEPSIKLINPTPDEIEKLMSHGRWIGFNNRDYDNHILWARKLGYSNEQLYSLSKNIIDDVKDCKFGPAFNWSYTDIYDFASAANKKSLKKWEIELGIHHQEMSIPWNEPVPEKMWKKVVEYCCNDVMATKALFYHLEDDWTARQILADLSGLSVNDTTNHHTTKIIFGNEKHPELVYRDLSEDFPGYEYVNGKNMYRGVDLGKGGYVYAEPGMYFDVALLDVKSMHPHSIIAMNLFGKYTINFKNLVDARVAVKEKRYEDCYDMFDGKLRKYLTDDKHAKKLSNALKTPINAVYGLTSASFDNPFRDKRNVNNIVALRGALFMKTLQDEVASRGFTVAHIKTDSIKMPGATQEIIDFCMDFAKKYGYEFDYEDNYKKMCLVNNAVYICKTRDNQWSATGAEFAVPYIFKSLFSHEEIKFEDLTVTKSVKTALYLDNNEKLPEGEHDYQFVGRIGLFCPMKPGNGGCELKVQRGSKYDYVSGCKGYRFLEAEVVRDQHLENYIDESYFKKLVDDAVDEINKYGDFNTFVD